MSNKVTYNNWFIIQKKLEKVVLQACPTMPTTSGIYFYTRVDEDGMHAYIGKAVNLLRRNASHLQGYQRIDKSLKKRGFYSPENEGGWHLNFLSVPENLLDQKEAYYIKQYQDAGYEMYNIESGGTTGKTMINERKGPKTYTEGKHQGRKDLAKEIRNLVEKYLVISTKKDSKLALNAMDKFFKLINEQDEEGLS